LLFAYPPCPSIEIAVDPPSLIPIFNIIDRFKFLKEIEHCTYANLPKPDKPRQPLKPGINEISTGQMP
jgi:hypothetical protein